MNNKINNKKVKKILALTLGLGLAVGSLTGAYTIAQANQRPAGIENMQTSHEKLTFDKADLQGLLTLLQIDEQDFKQDVDSGMSLTEIAGSYHVSRKPVVDVVVNNINQQVDKGLAEKRITVEQANELKTNALEKAQQIVDIKPIGFDNINDKENRQGINDKQNTQDVNKKQNPQDADAKQNRQDVNDEQNPQGVNKNMNQQVDKGLAEENVTAEERITVEQANKMKTNAVEKDQKMNDKQNSQNMNNTQNSLTQEILTMLKIDAQTFEQEQSSGKSLAEIAIAHNVSRQAVVDLVNKNINQQIDTGLAEKRITVEQANEMKTNAVEKAQEIVDKNMMEQPAQPQK